MTIEICDFGCGRPAIKMFKSSGKKCCSEFTSHCPEMKNKNSRGVSEKRQELGDKFWKNGHPKHWLGKQSPIKGKTYEELYGLEEATNRKEICRQTAKKHIAGIPHTEDFKKFMSTHAEWRHANGWDNKAGRCKKYKYYSEVAGEVTLDGTWELETAKWLDKNKFNWKRNKVRFEYIHHLTDKRRYYTPDFWVEEFGGYLEIKGYETDLDRCKWRQFPDKLIVWKKEELKENGVLP
jgi:hypothetical protein